MMNFGQPYQPGMPFLPASMDSDDRWALIHEWSSTGGGEAVSAGFHPDKQILFMSDIGKMM